MLNFPWISRLRGIWLKKKKEKSETTKHYFLLLHTSEWYVGYTSHSIQDSSQDLSKIVHPVWEEFNSFLTNQSSPSPFFFAVPRERSFHHTTTDSNVSGKGRNANEKNILYITRSYIPHTVCFSDFLMFHFFAFFSVLAHHLPLNILFYIFLFWQVSEKSVFSSHTLDIILNVVCWQKCIKTSFAYWCWYAKVCCQKILFLLLLISFGIFFCDKGWRWNVKSARIIYRANLWNITQVFSGRQDVVFCVELDVQHFFWWCFKVFDNVYAFRKHCSIKKFN